MNSTLAPAPVKAARLALVLPPRTILGQLDTELGITPIVLANGKTAFRVGRLTFARLEAAREYGFNLRSVSLRREVREEAAHQARVRAEAESANVGRRYEDEPSPFTPGERGRLATLCRIGHARSLDKGYGR